MSRRDQFRGYTLIEVLVVLTITAMVSGLLMQALAQVYGLQERIGVQLQRSQGDAMQADWYRQLVQQLQPDFPGSPGRMRGDARGFEALGLDPFSREQGVPVRLRLTLESRDSVTRLRMRAGERDVVLSEWEGLSDATLVYLDAKGERQERWPPAMGVWPALPAAVLLRLKQAEQEHWLSAVPRSSYQPFKRGNFIGIQP